MLRRRKWNFHGENEQVMGATVDSWKKGTLGACFVASTLLILLISNQEWLFPYGNPTDAWLNNTFFFEYGVHDPALYSSYKAVRLSWILKGLIAHKLFSSVVAYYVLHISVFAASVGVFFALSKMLFGAWPATIAAMVFATYSQYHSIISFEWDYGTHDSILNVLICMFGLALAARGRYTRIALLAAGMAAGCVVQSPYLVSYAPIIVAWYLLLNNSGTRYPIALALAWFIGGALTVTIFFCAVSYSVGGPIFYYWPQLKFAFMWGESGRYQASYWDPLGHAILQTSGVQLHLVVAAAAAAWGLLTGRYTKRSMTDDVEVTTGLWLPTLALGVNILLQTLGHPFINDSHFVVALTPTTCLGICAILKAYKQSFGRKASSVTWASCPLAGAILVGPMIFGLSTSTWPRHIPFIDSLIYLALAVSFVGIGTVLVRQYRLAVITLGVAIAISLINVRNTSIPLGLYDFRFQCGFFRDQYAAVIDAYRFIRAFDPKYTAWIWYKYNELIQPKKGCSAQRLASMLGTPAISTGALYGALWGARYYRSLPPTSVRQLFIESGAATKSIPPDTVRELLRQIQGVLGGYYMTKSFAAIPNLDKSKALLPKIMRVAVLAANLKEHEIAIDTLKTLRSSVTMVDRTKIEHGQIVFYITILDLSEPSAMRTK